VTDAGQRFYPRATAVLDAYDSALGEASKEQAIGRGRVRMSLPVVFGRLHVLPLLSQFLRKHEQLDLEMSFSDRYVNLVEEGYDLLVRLGSSPDSSFREQVLGSSERRLAASRSYLSRRGVPEAPASTSDED
jgi:DNA-binding transcriptional LysR family regulator